MLVALSVLAINLLAWTAALQIVFAIARRIALVEAQVTEDMALAEVCASLVVARPRLARRHHPVRADAAADSRRRRRAGLTLVEVLVAAAIGAAVLTLVAASVAMARRSTGAVLVASEAAIVRLALPAVLFEVVGAAGRGLDAVAEPLAPCGVDVEDGGRRLVVRYVERGEHVEEHLFAAADAARRPALYLRRLPHPRQPWIEDVTSLHVRIVDGAGSAWAHAARLEVEHRALEQPFVVSVPLTHHPCIGGTVP